MRLDFDILRQGSDNNILHVCGPEYDRECGGTCGPSRQSRPSSPKPMVSSSQSVNSVNSCTVRAYLPSLALRSGFLKILQSALRVKEDGLGAFGIPCHSYIFLNCPTHKRNSAQPFGDESLEYIRLANQRLVVGDSCYQHFSTMLMSMFLLIFGFGSVSVAIH